MASSRISHLFQVRLLFLERNLGYPVEIDIRVNLLCHLDRVHPLCIDYQKDVGIKQVSHEENLTDEQHLRR